MQVRMVITLSWNNIYYIIGGYYVVAGILGVGMYFIWITFRFRIKIYDFQDLYGTIGARILCIILGILIALFGYIHSLFW